MARSRPSTGQGKSKPGVGARNSHGTFKRGASMTQFTGGAVNDPDAVIESKRAGDQSESDSPGLNLAPRATPSRAETAASKRATKKTTGQSKRGRG